MIPCSSLSAESPCTIPTKRDEKQAREDFERGLKLEKDNQLDDALVEFQNAEKLVPRSIDYITAREMVKQQLVFEHVKRGASDMDANRQVEGMAEFRTALELDPSNAFAREQLRNAMGEWAPETTQKAQIVADAASIEVAPNGGRQTFHYRGDTRGLYTQISNGFGVTVIFDDSVVTRRVRFDVENVDFFTAMQLANRVSKSFWAPLDTKQVLVAADTPQNHAQFDSMALRTFYIAGITDVRDLTQLVTVLRSLFDVKFMTAQANNNTIVVRAPTPIVDAITHFLDTLDSSTPQVLLDVKVFQVSHTLMRNLGMHIPNTFTLFNIPVGALLSLGGNDIQSLINQLIASGGINQVGNQALSALLAQAGIQQSSIFSQPFATFGGGLTLMGLTLDTASITAQLNESNVQVLEHATMRASDGKDATIRLGTRYPILNASFAPVFNSPAIGQAIRNNSFSTFPSVNYEDLGLTVKAKPAIHSNNTVSLSLDLQLRNLGTASVNNIPVINNRQYTGQITLNNGEPAVVAGQVTRNDIRSLNGIPGLGAIPGVNRIAVENGLERDEDELLVVITPHVISENQNGGGAEIFLPPGQ
jgi:type II secretory pathway component GspD/PulD (secretin)